MILLCACGAPSNPNHEPSTESTASQTEQTMQTTADTSAKPEQSPVIPSDKAEQDSPDGSAWRAAYLEILEANKHCRSFALVYVDDNDVPELYIMGISEAEGDRVFSCIDGKVITLQLGRTGGGKYIERGGMIANENGNMGRYYTDIFELAWYGFSRTLHGATIVRYNFETGKDEYSYSIMGEDVSEETFHTLIHAEFDFSRAVKFTDSAVSYETAKQQLENEAALPDGYQTVLEKYQDVLGNKKTFQFVEEDKLLNECTWMNADRTYWEYCLIDMDGDGSVEMLIRDGNSEIMLLTVEHGTVYGFSFTFRGMYYVAVDGSFCWNYYSSYGMSKIAYFYNGFYETVDIYKFYCESGNVSKFFLHGKEVTADEMTHYAVEHPPAEQVKWHKLDTFLPDGNPSDSQITFIPQSEKDAYKEKLTDVLSSVKKSSYISGLGSFSAFGAGLMDINFDNVPEVLVAYPGGSMGNVFIEIYDLETGKRTATYNAAHWENAYNIYLCVAKFDGDYVILTEGSYREPAIGWIKVFGVLNQELSSDYLSGKALFAESEDAAYYEYNDEIVSKEEYQRQFGKFTMEYDKIEETQIIIVKWSDVGFDNEKSDGSDIDVYAEKLAEALIHSGQEFIEYQK